jgi:glutamyl-tRNA reductase
MNRITVISLNYKLTPLHIRSTFQFDEHEQKRWYENLDNYTGVVGGVLLSTCNRIEFYLETNVLFSCPLFLKQLQQERSTVIPYELFQVIENSDQSVQYVMEVSNGLHSMVVGDKQIIGQMRKAYRESLDASTLSTLLERMFQSVFRCFKDVHNTTSLHTGSKSISYLAVKKIQKLFPSSTEKPAILLIGAGETSADFLKYAIQGNLSVVLTNRSHAKGARLAEKFGVAFIPFEDFKTHLHAFDVIVSGAAAKAIIDDNGLGSARCTLLIDLTTHSSIQLETKRVQTFITLDDLGKDRAINFELHKQALIPACAVIKEEAMKFSNWLERRRLYTGDIVPAMI